MTNNKTYNFFKPGDCISEKIMFEYIDNKLNQKERHQVEKHLLVCELCSDALEGLELLKDRSGISRINQKITASSSAKSNKTDARIIAFNFRTFTAVAASLILLVGAVFFFNAITSNEKMSQDVAEVNSPDNSVPAESRSAPPPADQTISNEAALKTTSENAAIALEKSAEPDGLPEETTDIYRSDEPGQRSATGATATDEIAVSQETETNDMEELTTIDAKSQPVLAEKNNVAESEKMENTRQKSKDVNFATTTSTVSKNAESSQEKEEKIQADKKFRFESGKKDAQKPKSTKEIAADELSGGTIAYAPQSVKAEGQQNSQTQSDSTAISGDLSRLMDEDRMNVSPQAPLFPGGRDSLLKYLGKLNYPPGYKNEVKTDVRIQVTIDENGTVKKPLVTKSSGNKKVDKEALRLVEEMPAWNPGKKDGKAVAMPVNLTVEVRPK